MHFPEPQIGKELMALAINLAANSRNAELLSDEEVKVVVDRAFKHGDISLFKFIKNLAIHAESADIHESLGVNNIIIIYYYFSY